MDNILHTQVDNNRAKRTVQKFLTYIGLGPEDRYSDSGKHQSEAEQYSGFTIQDHYLRNHQVDNQQVYQTPKSVPNIKPGTLQVIRAGNFGESQKIADLYKLNCSVILNLENTDLNNSKRLVDFASGLVYGTGGSIQKISTHTFLLQPANSNLNIDTNNIQSFIKEAEMVAYN